MHPIFLHARLVAAGVSLLAGAWILSCTQALADTPDFTPDGTRYISDPTFLTVQGQWYSQTSVSRQTFNEDWQPAGFGIIEHYRATTNSYQEVIQYGATSRLNLELVGSYYDVTGHYTFAYVPGFDTSQKQFNDPELLVKYRAVLQTDDSVSVDLQLSVSPGVVSNTPGFQGAAAFVNHQWQSLTLQGEVGATHYDSFNASDELNAATSHISPQWDYVLAVRSQLRPSWRWAVNGGVVYTREDSYADSRSNGYTNYAVGASGVVDPYVEIVYKILPHRLNLGFEYDHEFVSDRTLSGGIDGTWLNQSRNLYTLRLRAVF